jgi:flagellar basal-body rod protein FlgF
MDSGYYAACAGLAAQTQALELVAHNLSNMGTTGYRGQQTTFRSLVAGQARLTGNAINAAINDYGVLSGSHLDQTEGSVAPTGNPLDLAIVGNGFFSVQSAEGIQYTRDGSFHLTAAGMLVTSQGNPVLGAQGPVTVPSGSLSVSADGTISVNNAVVGQLQLAEFAPATSLTAAGSSTYNAPPGSALVDSESSVRQGMLESSNVSATAAVAQLITVQRNAEMLSRALSAIDGQLNQIAAQDLPKV